MKPIDEILKEIIESENSIDILIQALYCLSPKTSDIRNALVFSQESNK